MEDNLRDKIFSATDGGLTILKDLYPGLTDENGQVRRKFKIRDEKTPSATALKSKDDIWYVTDFGDDAQARNAIDCWMRDRNWDTSRFGQACLEIASEYGLTELLSKDVNKSRCVERDARPEEKDGETYFEYRTFDDAELKLLGPGVTAELCERMGWHALEWIGRCDKRKIKEWHSDPHVYPIFARKCIIEDAEGKEKDHFFKIYRPKEPEKQYRFTYTPNGKKPKDYINGVHEMRLQYDHLNREAEQMADEEHPHKPQKLCDFRHKGVDRGVDRYYRVVLCSGERDALCVAARGDIPLWLNSETATLNEADYRRIISLAGELHNIPDLDITGVRRGSVVALRYPDIKTVWLPGWLGYKKDNRGRPRKDFRDWCDLMPSKAAYYDLMDTAASARFWDTVTNKDGQRKFQIVTHNLFNFLRLYGFHILHDENISDPQYIRIVDNVVTRKTPRDIRDFVRRWTQNDVDPDREGQVLRESSNIVILQGIRNMVLTDVKLSSAYLAALPEANPDFTTSGPDRQRFFFRSGVVTVSKQGIKYARYRDLDDDTYCWKHNVIPRDYRELQPFFRIWRMQDADGRPAVWEDGSPAYDIEILDAKSSPFFGYLINSSRLHWRREIEDAFPDADQRREYMNLHRFDIAGPTLKPKEIQEQKRCLINKIFTIAYIAHGYKSPSRAWAPYLMDNRIAENSKSNGRSGKSFFFKLFEMMQMSIVKLSGRNDHLTDNPHIYDQVTRFTQILQIDDLSQRVQDGSFYDSITGDMTVNPKNNQSYTIPFAESPKFCFTTNFVPSDFDPSSDARRLPVVFGDYYHQRTADGQSGYLETRSIRDDFGKDLFGSHYTDDEYNADQNLLLQCLAFYMPLTDEPVKLIPPMDNIIQRKLISNIGEQVLRWMDEYFAPDCGRFDQKLLASQVYSQFLVDTKLNLVKPQGFTSKLKDFARLRPWIAEINPPDQLDSQGRCKWPEKKVNQETGSASYPEAYYLRSNPDWHPNPAASDVDQWAQEHDGEIF